MNALVTVKGSSPSPAQPGLQQSIAAGVSYNTLARSTQRDSGTPKPIRKQQLKFLNQVSDLEGQLFDSRAAFKIEVATIAMHLDGDWRSKLFGQIDQLLDKDEWDPDDVPVTHRASTTFLRMILFLRPSRRPGLGATQHGSLVATWSNDNNRLTLVCEPGDRVRWIVTSTRDGEPESASGSTVVSRLPAVLLPYEPVQWFNPMGTPK